MSDRSGLEALMINDNGFAFDPATGQTYRLSSTALDVVRWLKEGSDQADLVDRLVATYEVDRRTAARDITDFLTTLQASGLLNTDASERR